MLVSLVLLAVIQDYESYAVAQTPTHSSFYKAT